jgi:hypothetical protein
MVTNNISAAIIFGFGGTSSCEIICIINWQNLPT